MRTLFFLSVIILFIVPARALASPVISEVMWMGTGLSSSDEWLEVMNPDAQDTDLSGWSVTSVNSSGKEIVSYRFATGAVVAAGEYIVIASKTAANSHLQSEPYGVSSALSLPNTKLQLRLRDAENSVIDEVDDGAGAPFAGENPSGNLGKASMERIDPAVLGTIKENWRTATSSLGFDPDTGNFGTPGFPFEADEPVDDGSCSDPLEIAIAVQSGPLLAVGKATVNFQAVATEGTLSGVVCSWSYGDGFLSTSCNPPVHTFANPGTYSVRLEAKNQCGITLTQEQIVEVKPDPSSQASNQPNTQWYDGSKLMITGALPNPVGTDTGKEWIEIKNLEDRAVDLRGWKLAVGETSIQSYLLPGSIGPKETLRMFDSELKFKLPNTSSKLQLMTPSGIALSSVLWKSAEEDRVYLPDEIRSLTVRGRVVKVTGPVTFILQLEPDAASVLGDDTVNVLILGVTPNPDVVIKNNEGPYEMLRALIENKNIELQFDTDLWDDMGRLLAHVYIEGGILAETQMIISKLWVVDNDLQYVKKKEFQDLERSLTSSDPEESSSLQADFSAVRLALSEIYPAPFPLSKDSSEAGWKNQEWLEIENLNQKAVDLSGWKLKTEKSEKSLPEGLKVASGSKLIIYTSSIKLSLRNAGDIISLVSPDGTIVASLEYPELKNGMSYAAFEGDFCTTIQPTPGEGNACAAAPTKVAKAKAAPKTATTAKKVSARVKSYAASYRAQANTEASEVPLVLASPKPVTSDWQWIVFAFIVGFGFSGIGLLIAHKQRWLVIGFSPAVAVAK